MTITNASQVAADVAADVFLNCRNGGPHSDRQLISDLAQAVKILADLSCGANAPTGVFNNPAAANTAQDSDPTVFRPRG